MGRPATAPETRARTDRPGTQGEARIPASEGGQVVRVPPAARSRAVVADDRKQQRSPDILITDAGGPGEKAAYASEDVCKLSEIVPLAYFEHTRTTVPKSSQWRSAGMARSSTSRRVERKVGGQSEYRGAGTVTGRDLPFVNRVHGADRRDNGQYRDRLRQLSVFRHASSASNSRSKWCGS